MIRRVEKSELANLMQLAKREGLFFNKSTNIYWGAFVKENLIGFCGVMLSKNKATLKNAFVLKKYRGCGVYTQLNAHRFEYIRSIGVTVIEANVTETSLPYHLKNGAQVVRVYNNCKKVRYING